MTGGEIVRIVDEPRLALSMAETADTLGVARQTVYDLVERGDLLTFRVGRRRLIAVAELVRFIAAHGGTVEEVHRASA